MRPHKRLSCGIIVCSLPHLNMDKRFSRSVAIAAAWLAGACFCVAEDWTQYRGKAGDATSREPIGTTWPADGPKRLWTAKTPGGFSSLVTSGGRVFTVVSRE